VLRTHTVSSGAAAGARSTVRLQRVTRFVPRVAALLTLVAIFEAGEGTEPQAGALVAAWDSDATPAPAMGVVVDLCLP